MLIGPIEGDGGGEGDEEVLKGDWGLGGDDLVAKAGPGVY